MLKRAFVASPLSAAMIKKISLKYNCQFDQITLAYLKNLGIISTIKFLRSVSEMFVILEDEESEKISDLFLLLFLFSKSKKLEFIKKDLSTYSCKKRHVLFAVLKNVCAVVFGFYYAIKIFFISLFIKNNIKNVAFKKTNDMFYLKTNFWLGLKAGGSIAHTEGIIGGLKKTGFNIDFAAIDSSVSLKPLINNYFSLTIPYLLSPIFSLNLYIFDQTIYNNLKYRNLKKYSFIYHRMSLNSLSAVLLSRRFKIPLIVEYNGSEVWVQRNWGKPLFLERISQAVENATLRCANYIVTISTVLKNELIQRGIPEEKIIFYPNCVDPDKFNGDLFTEDKLLLKKKELGFCKEDVILTFIGTFGKWHGVEILANTIERLSNSDLKWLKDKRVKFMMVGDGACMSEVKNIFSSIPNYSKFIKLTGLISQEEIPEFLAISDILLSPHFPPYKNERFFGSPTKLFEYMAMKKVIIASDLEQITEVLAPSIHINDIENIDESRLAILSEPGNIDDLQKAIKYAVNNYSKLRFMGHNTRHKALKNYTWQRHVEEILSKT